MRTPVALAAALLPMVAQAHPGHVAPLDGHAHPAALAAFAIALAVVLASLPPVRRAIARLRRR